MAVIIGGATNVSVGGVSDGIQSVSWQVQVQTNRLWSIGQWTPYKTQITSSITASITAYAGAIAALPLAPSDSCANSDAVHDIIISPGQCGAGAVDGVDETMYLTSYSYSKGDPTAFGTESWSFQLWVDASLYGGADPDILYNPAPDYVIQGISEGNASGNVTNLGVTFSTEGQVQGQQGNVSAGFPGIGQADTITYGIVTNVGGGSLGDLPADRGKVGNSSASIPHQPLYLGEGV